MAGTEHTTRRVLLAGASGMLGGAIADVLLAEPGVELRILLRPGASGRPGVQDLMRRGAQPVEGDLSSPASLTSATDGVDVVVSAVQGGRDVIVDGQVALATAAAANGVGRILPSDFALDLFRAPPGEHATFDLRREADEAIAELDIEQVNVLSGALMDGFLHAFFDHAGRTATYWGTGEETFDATSVEDTARYTARAALGSAVPAGKFAVAGEQLSFGQMTDAVEAVTGHQYTRRSLGGVADLRAAIAETRRADPDPMAAVMNVYQLFMLTGQTALTDLQNDRYPDIRPLTFKDLAHRALGA